MTAPRRLLAVLLCSLCVAASPPAGAADPEATYPSRPIKMVVPYAAGGSVEIKSPLVEWAAPANRGDARVLWIGAWLAVPGSTEPVALGDITATLTAAADRLSGPVSNVGGDLAVRGTVTLVAQGVQLSLVLAPRRADDRKLAQVLSMIGAPEGDGWRVEWRFPLR